MPISIAKIMLIRFFTISFVLSLPMTLYATYCNSEKIKAFCHNYKPYQDIVINNEIVYKGWNSDYCALRYEIIKDIMSFFINDYEKQLKLLDVGAAQGYFSFRLSGDFNITSFMIENGQSASDASAQESLIFLKELCLCNNDTNKVCIIPASVNHDTLAQFSPHSIDIALALSIIHHLPDWKEVIDTLATIAKLVIIEIPIIGVGDLSDMIGLDQLEQIYDHITSIGGYPIASCPRYYQGQRSLFYVIQK